MSYEKQLQLMVACPDCGLRMTPTSQKVNGGERVYSCPDCKIKWVPSKEAPHILWEKLDDNNV